MSPRRWHPLTLGVLAAAVALLAAVGAGAGVEALQDDGADSGSELRLSPEDGSGSVVVAPDVAGEQLPEGAFERLDGGEGRFADYRGRPLVVNFFASWCAPCEAEMPAFEQVHQEVGDDVAFLGMNLQDDDSAARDLIDRTGVTYDIALDPDGALFEALEGLNMPTTYFVSADGEVLDVRPGAIDLDDLRAEVEELTT